MKFPELPDKQSCTGCMACVDSCNHEALIPKFSRNGFLVPTLEKAKCRGCLKCELICPVNNPTKIPTNRLYSARVYAGWTSREGIRTKSSSGGAFYEIAFSFIKAGGVVIGAELDENNNVRHIVVKDTIELEKLQGSKYVQSETVGIYDKVHSYLSSNQKVLFSGLPCQIAGLYTFLRELSVNRNLYTIELICHGVPSRLLTIHHLEINRGKRILSYRTKSLGWTKSNSTTIIDFNNNVKTINKYRNDLFFRSFRYGTSLMHACYKCTYSKLPRHADLTLGDFWGCKKWPEQIKDGISLVISNNSKGHELIELPHALTLNKIQWTEVLAANPNLYINREKLLPISLSPYLYKILKYLPNYLSFNLLAGRIATKRDFIFLPWSFYVDHYSKKYIKSVTNALNNQIKVLKET